MALKEKMNLSAQAGMLVRRNAMSVESQIKGCGNIYALCANHKAQWNNSNADSFSFMKQCTVLYDPVALLGVFKGFR